jgi:hypothetical protein
VATFYAVMIKTDYMQKDTFNLNFWEGFKAVLGKGHVIKVGHNISGTSALYIGILRLLVQEPYISHCCMLLPPCL